MKKAVRGEVLEGCWRVYKITDLPEAGASALGEGFSAKLRPKIIDGHEAIFRAPPRLVSTGRVLPGCRPPLCTRPDTTCTPSSTPRATQMCYVCANSDFYILAAIWSFSTSSLTVRGRYRLPRPMEDPMASARLVPCLDVDIER